MARKNSDVTRTLRIEGELDSALQKFAQDEGISVNALANRIIRKYVQWDAYAKKFGFITNSSQQLQKMMSYLTEDEARECGRWTGTSFAREYVSFWFKELNFKNLLEGARLLSSEYAGHYKLEESRENGVHIMIVHHGRGRKWSLFYEEAFKVGLKELAGVDCEIDVSENQIIVRIPLKMMESQLTA
jgi:hypothetical protein